MLKHSIESTFHDNSSKIWVITRVTEKGVNRASLRFANKDIILFFKSKRIVIQPMNTLGHYPKKTGILTLENSNKEACFTFGKEKWRFTISEITSDRIKLVHTHTSDFKFDLEMISYPENY